jgi:tetratricopeptide (TPR) repeat protein
MPGDSGGLGTNTSAPEQQLRLLVELIGKELEPAAHDLEEVVSRVRRNVYRPMTWRDAEHALLVATGEFARDDAQSAYAWSTLALAVLQITQTDVSSIRSRLRRELVERSGHARKLEASARELRGAADTELGRFDVARDELERAHSLYQRARDADGEHRALRVSIRLAHLELLREHWQEAELRAETTLRRMSGWDAPADEGECILVIGHAQLGMRRLQAALNSSEQALTASKGKGVLAAQAYLLKAMVELESGKTNNAVRDCQSARRLFDEAGNKRGIHDCAELQLRIAKTARGDRS